PRCTGTWLGGGMPAVMRMRGGGEGNGAPRGAPRPRAAGGGGTSVLPPPFAFRFPFGPGGGTSGGFPRPPRLPPGGTTSLPAISGASRLAHHARESTPPLHPEAQQGRRRRTDPRG